MRIAVVGAGIIGVSCAWRLAEKGHQVDLIEPRVTGHTQGSSHGRSRIVRRTYDDPFYTAIMTDAYPMWREVEKKSKTKLLHECGLLLYGPEGSRMVEAAEQSMLDANVPFQAVKETQEGPKMQKGERGLLVPEAGWVDAPLTWAALRQLALNAGAKPQVREATPDEDFADYDRVVLAVGPWIKQWVPDLNVQVTLQTFAYARTPQLVGGPVWIHDVPEYFYGFPSEPQSRTVKIGVHAAGEPIPFPHVQRIPNKAHAEAIFHEARDRFSALSEPLEVHTCLYTTTPDDDFRIGWCRDKMLFISACSGHAFKMAPWLGGLVADVLEGGQDPADWPRFRWSRG